MSGKLRKSPTAEFYRKSSIVEDMRIAYTVLRNRLDEVFEDYGSRADLGDPCRMSDSCFDDAINAYAHLPEVQTKVIPEIIINAAKSGCRVDHYIEGFETLLKEHEEMLEESRK